VLALVQRLSLPLDCIGRIDAGTAGALTILDATGQPVEIARRGYDHFAP